MTDTAEPRSRLMLAVRALVIALGLCLASPAAAQDASLQASISSPTIRKGDILTLQIEVVSESRDAATVVSDMKGLRDFRVLSDERFSSTTIVNGQMSRSVEFIYRLRPRDTGRLEIPPIEIALGSEMLRTERFEVEVTGGGGGLGPGAPPILVPPPGAGSSGGTSTAPTPASPGAGPPVPGGQPRRVPRPGEPWFLEVETSDETVWLGQPTHVDYRFLRSSERSVAAEVYDVQEPDFKGFWPREDEGFVAPQTVQRAGEEYYTESLRRYVLVPIETGELAVSAINAQVLSGSSPYGLDNKEWVTSPSATIKVNPLPPGAPPGFDVANVAKNVTLKATPRTTGGGGLEELRIGDSVTLTVELTAEGLIEQMRLMPIADDARLLTFGPKIVSESYNTEYGTLYGTRSLSFDFAPAAEGRYQIPAVRFVYFDFDSGEYAEEVHGPWPIEVRGRGPNADNVLAQLAARQSAASSGDIADEGTAGSVPMLRDAVIAPAATTPGPLYTRAWYLALMAVAPLLWIGLVGFMRVRRHRAEGAPDRRVRGALGRALKALRKASRAHASDAAAFAAELDTIVRGYLSERFELRARALTGDQLVGALRRQGASASTARALSRLLSDAASARYGAGSDALSIDDALERAREALTDLDAATAGEPTDPTRAGRRRRGREGATGGR